MVRGRLLGQCRLRFSSPRDYLDQEGLDAAQPHTWCWGGCPEDGLIRVVGWRQEEADCVIPGLHVQQGLEGGDPRSTQELVGSWVGGEAGSEPG